MTSEERTKLIETLKAAKAAGLATSRASEDGGTCNFDCPVLYLSPMPQTKTMEAIAKEADLPFVSKWAGGWRIGGCSSGQANAHTRGAEAAEKVLKNAGFETGMFYQMD